MEHTENPPYRFWHQGIVNNNIDSSVNYGSCKPDIAKIGAH